MRRRGGLGAAVVVIALGIWLAWPARSVTPPGSRRAPAYPSTSEGVGHPGRMEPRMQPDAATEPGPLPRLVGEVRDETGGVAQAEVEAKRRSSGGEAGCETMARSRSVAGGSFELGPLCPGQYDLRASRPPLAATGVVRLARGLERERVTLQLRTGTRLEVTVRDDHRAALAAAEVEVQDEVSGYSARAQTDAKGIARFEGLTPRQHTIVARKEGHLRATIADRPLALVEDRVELVLAVEAVVRGKVVGAEGEPLAEAELRLGTRGKRLNEGQDTLVRVSSEDGGSFAIGRVRPGDYTLVVRHPGFRHLEQAVRAPSSNLLLRLTRGASLDGVVLDPDGEPVASAEIHGRGAEELDSFDAELIDGGFQADGLSQGKWTVLGIARTADGGAAGIAVTTFELRGEPRVQVTLQLERGETISGRCVVEPGGGPARTDVVAVEEAVFQKIMLSGANLSNARPGSLSVANCEGSFRAEGLKPGRYRLVACSNHEDPPTASTGATNALVTCPATGRLRFRVVDPARRPVTRFHLGTGGDGLEEYPDGRYERPLSFDLDEVVSIRAPGFALLQRQAKARRTEQLDLGELVLSAARRLEGRVVNRAGQPIEGAELRFQLNSAEAFHRARTQRDGTFELAEVPQEDSQLHVDHPDYQHTEKPVAATQRSVEVRMEPARRLTGNIVTADGRSPAGFQVTAVRKGEPAAVSGAVLDGRYELGSLAEGEWSIRLSAGEGTPARASGFSPIRLALRGGGEQSADFVERLGGTSFSIAPIDEEGRAISAEVWLVPGQLPPPPTALAMTRREEEEGLAGDADQALHVFTAVPSGKWTVVVHVSKLARTFWLTPLEVGPGMPSVLRLMTPRGLRPSP